MEQLKSLGDLIYQGIQRSIEKLQYLTGISDRFAPLVFWLIIVYLLVFFLLIPGERALKRKKIGLQQQIVEQVDEMIYLLAKAQHLQQIDLKSLGGNPNIALMKSIFTKGNADYIQSSFLILDNMHKVETLLGSKVVSTEKEVSFLKLLKKYRRVHFFDAFLKGIIVVATLGVYALVG